MSGSAPEAGTADRRLRRRARRWRAIALVSVLTIVIMVIGRAQHPIGPHIARLTIEGTIGEDQRRIDHIRALADDPNTKAILLVIDSPGGTVGGGESLHDAIAYLAASKPVVAVMRGMATSAAYMAAVPAQWVVARGSTLTGSIGVILETGDAAGLLNKLGMRTESLVSGPLKDQPNPFRGLSDQGRMVLQGLVTDLYDQFVQIVATGRKMDPAAVRALADGRAYTGRQALTLKLVDALGGESEARDWLAKQKGIPLSVEVRDERLKPRPGLLAQLLNGDDAETGSAGVNEAMLGLMAETARAVVDKLVLSQAVVVDEPQAVWHPSSVMAVAPASAR